MPTLVKRLMLALPLTLACAIDDRVPDVTLGAGGMDTGNTGEGGSAGSSPGGSSPGGGGAAAGGSGGAAGFEPSGGASGATSAGSAGSGGGSPPDGADAGGEADGPPCSGCVELAVPVTQPMQQAGFQFVYAAPLDFSSGSVTWRVKVPAGGTRDDYFINLFVQNGAELSFGGFFSSFTALNAESGFVSADAWVDVTLDAAGVALPPEPNTTAFDKRAVIQVGIIVGATAELVEPGTVRVFVDSVTITDVPGAASTDFSSGAADLTLNSFQVPPGTLEPIHLP